MRHHRVRSRVELVILRVQEDGMLPVVVTLASLDDLRDVQLRSVQLDEIHELFGLVLGVEDRQLGVHANVGTIAGEAAVEEADESLEGALLLVLSDELLQMVRVHDDVHASDLCASELLGLDASNVHLLPCLGVVSLPCRFDGLGVLAQVHVARGELRIVGDGSVEDLGGLVRTLIVEAVAHRDNVGSVCAAHKLLHLGQSLRLRISVDKLGVDGLVLCLGAGHEEVSHELVVVLLALGCLDDLGIVCGILGLKVGVDGLGHLATLQLSTAQLVPDDRLIATGGKLLSPLQGIQICEERVHRLGVEVALLVDKEGLLVKAVWLPQRDLGDLRAIVVVEAVDVVHDPRLVGLDGRKNEEVLQVAILAEVRGFVKDHLLEEPDELVREVCADESLHSGGDLVCAGGLGQGGAHHLVDDVALVLALRVQHQRPQLRALALHQVAGLKAEEAVAVRHVHKLLVAGAPSALVGGVGEVRILVLDVLAHSGRVVEGVRLQELLRVPVGVDVDHRHSVVQLGLLVPLRHTALEPRQEHAEAIPLRHLCDEGRYRASGPHSLEQGLDKVFRAVEVDEGSDDERALRGVHLDNVHFDVLHQGVLVEVLCELAHVIVEIADVDQGPRVGELRLLQEVLHCESVVASALPAHTLDLLHVPSPASGLDVTEVHIRIGARVQDPA
mmetsp:Transcript_49882/g.106893  ORF Transcript_49882/g.106893 Transcript_49882/m.106893 type:complete len:672 (-) Transcript_49882:2191-4206(-)